MQLDVLYICSSLDNLINLKLRCLPGHLTGHISRREDSRVSGHFDQTKPIITVSRMDWSWKEKYKKSSVSLLLSLVYPHNSCKHLLGTTIEYAA